MARGLQFPCGNIPEGSGGRAPRDNERLCAPLARSAVFVVGGGLIHAFRREKSLGSVSSHGMQSSKSLRIPARERSAEPGERRGKRVSWIGLEEPENPT